MSEVKNLLLRPPLVFILKKLVVVTTNKSRLTGGQRIIMHTWIYCAHILRMVNKKKWGGQFGQFSVLFFLIAENLICR